MSLQIQHLTPDDAAQYRALMLEAYERHPQAFTSSVREREKLPLAWWAARLDGELDLLLGAFSEGRLLGIVGLAFELREKARHKATLFGLYVTGEQRSCGLGYQLVQRLLAEAADYEGLHLVQLTVTAGNDAALSVYRRCGFVQFGLEPQAVCVGEDYLDKIHMWREVPR
ncbi:GNAT family N-acetyltransferase [Pseudomonas chlororaphis]|nr:MULTISPECIES: GNAT family N-acetyltransferase [Pseudomonas chlororaphis group]MCO7576838.1 GNAT family N-acetyltransferase [Pseudomonas protegens]MCO7583213.1 GNAT family N-acetyltransferase [Pseudomonas chlororaphis]MCO7600653.1 GNAT family N-acetyltransferase [Pseudomonas chlororaphis]